MLVTQLFQRRSWRSRLWLWVVSAGGTPPPELQRSAFAYLRLVGVCQNCLFGNRFWRSLFRILWRVSWTKKFTCLLASLEKVGPSTTLASQSICRQSLLVQRWCRFEVHQLDSGHGAPPAQVHLWALLRCYPPLDVGTQQLCEFWPCAKACLAPNERC